eukprot:Amastigsp_a181216_10.p4 type:complete len:105 gc:universal Amastigsp_a181216_10:495-181(-)
MCMHPWFFWIGTRHRGHGLVLAITHEVVSADEEFLAAHMRTCSHVAGAWSSSAQKKHHRWPQVHLTWTTSAKPRYDATSTQPGRVQNLNDDVFAVTNSSHVNLR